MSLREICHCGHDKLSHYADPAQGGARCACMGLGGCDCERYVNENDPKPPKKVVRPAHPSHCRCSRCKDYLRSIGAPTDPEPDNGPKTDPYPFGSWP